jgi:hypothetical protein
LTPRQRQLAEGVRSEASSINTTFMCETAKAAGQVLRPDQELFFGKRNDNIIRLTKSIGTTLDKCTANMSMNTI